MSITTSSYFPEKNVALERSTQDSQIVPANANCEIDRLCNELLARIISFLSPANVAKAAQVCKKFYSIVKMDFIWRFLFQKCFSAIHPSPTTSLTVEQQFKLTHQLIDVTRTERKRIVAKAPKLLKDLDEAKMKINEAAKENKALFDAAVKHYNSCNERIDVCLGHFKVFNDEFISSPASPDSELRRITMVEYEIRHFLHNQDKFDQFIASAEQHAQKLVQKVAHSVTSMVLIKITDVVREIFKSNKK